MNIPDNEILAFVAHKWNCGHLQPMWHQGLCDCGLHALLDELRSTGLTKIKSFVALSTLYALLETCSELMSEWEASSKTTMPDELYMCLKCVYMTAEKRPTAQGWDGFCHHCGPISQDKVGKLAFSKPNLVPTEIANRSSGV